MWCSRCGAFGNKLVVCDVREWQKTGGYDFVVRVEVADAELLCSFARLKGAELGLFRSGTKEVDVSVAIVAGVVAIRARLLCTVYPDGDIALFVVEPRAISCLSNSV